jgi:hypothetical protein
MDALVSGLALVSSILAQSAPPASDPLFSGRMVETGQDSWIQKILAADVDSDGHLDLVTSTGSPHTVVSVLLGDGRGGLQWSVTREGPPSSGGLLHLSEIAVLDVDGDALPDVVTSGLPDELLIFRGDGMGGLASPIELALPGVPLELRSADLDGDGILDLVTRIEREVVVLLRKPAGGLAAPSSYSLGPVGVAQHLEIGDVDGDQALDVLSMVGTTVRLLRNAGDGTFLPVETLQGLAPAQGIALGEFNGDRRLDLAAYWTSQPNASGISFYVGDGTGEFALQARRSIPGSGSLTECDLIDGGTQEIAFAQPDGLHVISLYSDAIENLGPVHPGVWSFALADLDEDGRQDLIEQRDADDKSPRVAVHLGSGDGTLVGLSVSAEGFEAWLASLRDVDRDGWLDAIGSFDRLVQIAPGTGGGRFGRPHSVRAPSPVTDVQVGDFDGDGLEDLMLISNSPPGVSLAQGTGNLSFRPAQTLLLPAFSYDLLLGVVADFDRDGRQELALSAPNRESVGIIGASPSGAPVLEDWLATPGSVGPVAARDLQCDGAVDVLYLKDDLPAGTSLWSFQSNLAGAYGPPQHFLDLPLPWIPGDSVHPWPGWIELDDLDLDGLVDVVARRSVWLPPPAQPSIVSELAIWRQSASGTWALADERRVDAGLTGKGLVDLDGDGKPELAYGILGWLSTLGVWRLDHGVPQREPDRYASPSPQMGDVDGDGRPDAVGSSNNHLVTLLNLSGATR